MEKMLWQPFTAEARRKLMSQPVALMTTYRKGTKWLNPALIGQTVELMDEKDRSVFGTARIVSVKACQFRDIDNLDQDRQSSEMRLGDRLEIMRRVYGEYSWETLTTVVTLGDVHDIQM